ncbi:MAG TPA: PaaI family thioesterase [Actinomycetales bacterium]|nr:PaaI family thioesterase [Actinomycetales bacterium]
MRELTIEDARTVLAAQPFSRLLGARLVEFRRGFSVLEVPQRVDHAQQHGFVHGGVIAYAADNVAAFAAGTVLGPSVVTAQLEIDFRRPATSGLRAEGEVIDHDDRGAECRCRVLDANGTVCATATALVRLTRPNRRT